MLLLFSLNRKKGMQEASAFITKGTTCASPPAMQPNNEVGDQAGTSPSDGADCVTIAECQETCLRQSSRLLDACHHLALKGSQVAQQQKQLRHTVVPQLQELEKLQKDIRVRVERDVSAMLTDIDRLLQTIELEATKLTIARTRNQMLHRVLADSANR